LTKTFFFANIKIMDTETLFRFITFLSLALAVGISVYFRHRAEREGGQLDRSEGQGLLVIMRLVGLIAILPLVGYLLNPAWVAWARVPLPEWLRWLGAVVALIMPAFIYWLFVTIGNNISPVHTTRSDHQLITGGPYRWIRHPLYTFGSIFFIALTVLTGLWWLAVGMGFALALLAWRTPREEAHLLAKFGDEYRAYMDRTGRYLPRLF
jgi:protein-S-isoprenylcysteine O-methyltransferase Ste14